MPTIAAAIAAARTRLRGAGVPVREAELDASLLARHLLRWDAARLIAAGADAVPADFAAAFDALVDRRARREPVAYILGKQEFWGLEFRVGPGVLIPRPETESIVQAALDRFPPEARLIAADVGTGSGCIAVALAHERPNAKVVAMDVSSEALAIAAANAQLHGTAERISFVPADLFADGDRSRLFDLIVSNPPYVPDGDRASLQPEVLEHEPAEALFAGSDGLDVIRRLLPAAATRLKPGGYLIFEIGMGQDRAVRQLVAATPGLDLVEIRPDLQGIPRTVIAAATLNTP
jgi:release factor glutamine methyltransferase